MLPLYEDPWFTFRFADDRIIPRFHLEGVEAGRRVSVFKIDPGTGERLGLLATATVGEGGWVDLAGADHRAGRRSVHRSPGRRNRIGYRTPIRSTVGPGGVEQLLICLRFLLVANAGMSFESLTVEDRELPPNCNESCLLPVVS